MDPLLKKLHYKTGVVVVRDVPPELAPVLQDWQDNGVDVDPMLMPGATFVLAFVKSQAQIREQAKTVVESLSSDDPVLWFAYPKKASKKYTSDVSRDDSWQPLVDLGFKPVQQVAVDENWSALRFRRPA